jgi:hypothetical protein
VVRRVADKPEKLEAEVVFSKGLGHPAHVPGAKERNDERRKKLERNLKVRSEAAQQGKH